MKIIKKISLLTILIIITNQIAAQGTPTCGGTNSPLPSWYTPNWNWVDATPSNWYGNITTGTLAMGSPFSSNTNTNDMLKILDALDYDPLQGWTLLAKDFGVIGQYSAANATPYFMLYNKYKSIVRLFIYYGNTNSNLNRASVILKWSGNNGASDNNSLLTLSNNFALANENYPITNNAEKHVNYMNQVSYLGAWGVTEYLVNFDPNTLKNVGNFQYMNFDFKLSAVSTISLTGDFSFSTESATPKDPPAPTVNGSNPNLLDYVLMGKSALAKAPKQSELVAGFNTIATKVFGINEKFCNDFTYKLTQLNSSLQNGKLKQYLLGAAKLAEGAGGVLGTAASVLEVFMSKSNTAAAASTEAFVQPTISKGTMSLSGTIVAESNPLSISIQLPGTSHKYANGTVNCPNLPVYDCPMGVISMQEAPTIITRTWVEPEQQSNYVCSVDFSAPAGVCGTPPNQFNQTVLSTVGSGSGAYDIYRRTTTCPVPYNNKTIKSYKVTGDIKLALNGAAGVTIESTKAALFFVIKNNGGTPAVDILKSGVITPTSCCNPVAMINAIPSCAYVPAAATSPVAAVYFNVQNSYVNLVPYKNYTKSLLNAGDLKLSNYDNVNGLHSFQTPFIDIDKFKNTAVTIEDGCDVYLKLLITMKPNNLSDDQTPIVNLVTYQIPQNKLIADNILSTPYPMTCDQRLEEDTVIVGTSNVTSTITNVAFMGYAIKTATNSITTANPSSITNLEAYSAISLKPEFSTQVQSGGGTFTAKLNSNLQGCATSSSALVLQTYTYNCPGNASVNRFANFTNQDNKNEETAKLTLAEEIQNIRLKIAPNPNNGSFSLLFNKKVNSGTVILYNSMGQEVHRQYLTSDADTYELNFSEYLTLGAYYLSWNNATFVIRQKFIVN